MKDYVIGVDLGGTKISCGLATVAGIVEAKWTVPTEAHLGETVVLDNIINSINKVMELGKVSVDNIKAIGVGSPGPLDIENGLIITTPNLPFKNFNLVEPIKEEFEVPVFLDNDANVAAVGEYMLGAARGLKNMVYVTVSTGVGGGAVLDGKVYRGSTYNALEVGHMTLDPFGPTCGCGNNGCLEALSSGTAIAKKAKEALDSKVETSLRNYEKVTSYEVFLEAEKGDMVAKEIIDRAMFYLGIGIANMITAFDPEMVVIGGGVSKAGDIVFDKVKEVVNRRTFKTMSENCKIVPAGLGVNAGMLGAVALAIVESENMEYIY